ncbi:hypothetical protein [Treponema saccharophilum]|uniref:hypothetical protein n=1 Tax=Treponema saccharophilum TaxID=165 RepID=UPI00386819C8
MAMDKGALGKAIAAKVTDPSAPAEMKSKIESMWTDIAGVIIAHIQQNAVVTVGAGIAVSTSGTAAAQAGATTAPGTGTIA